MKIFKDGEVIHLYTVRHQTNIKVIILWVVAICAVFAFLLSTASFASDLSTHESISTGMHHTVDVAMNRSTPLVFTCDPRLGFKNMKERRAAMSLSVPAGMKIFFQRIGSSSIYQTKKHGSVYIFKSGMNIDADGAFTAYHPLPGKGLDHLGNAGRPGNWWGIVTHNTKRSGKPVLQDATDPAPGYYVSGTSLQDATKENNDPTRYVNSEAIPFFVLPGDSRIPATMGDFGYVVNMDTAMSSGCIFADVGPDNKIGEGSIALARAVGIPSDPRGEGTTDQMIYVVFTDTSQGWPVDKKYIDSHSNQLFEQWGGMERLRREMY
ncbi:hypothetical protein G3N56_00320 [Desulfovibrio sulfodismutans]|uniref:Uncharacterized protein n=1 Tax=Desulfolutivibrio sulfodismutans TaxID=63561 RepID=A0A7K3NIZ5_9BACT|nr:glycoside hydrolase family 75 protein [Desulfolutivibrio sulfodismutans]NDY55189.1 hypothetical protein [Desulfolutivibrio sulfodismutans]QLA12155.1 hypothetical protein GD606_07655 [Desulfolutivibrio sulfodismutans DSM 3696]